MNHRTFERQLNFVRLPAPVRLEQLRLRGQTAQDPRRSDRLRQLRQSIERFGQLTAIVVVPVPPGMRESNDDRFFVADGELRVSALRLLRAQSAVCLQPVAKRLRPAERLNLPSIAREHQILSRAAEFGMGGQYLAEVFGIEVSDITLRLGMLDRICADAQQLIGETPVSEGVYRCLRRLVPERQVEVARAMLDLEDFSARVALALVRSTSREQFVRKPRFAWNDAERAAAKALRESFAAATAETRRLAAHHAHAAMELCILTAHVRKLLTNPSLVRWLAIHRPEQLQRLAVFSEPAGLNASSDDVMLTSPSPTLPP
jgi:ParB-like chromosome segregation protein Spo0J